MRDNDHKSKGLTIAGRDRAADQHKLAVAWVNRLQWENCEYGAWSNNPKRPFGNSGNEQIAEDILKILGAEDALPRCPHCDGVIDASRKEAMHAYAHDLFKGIPEHLAKIVR